MRSRVRVVRAAFAGAVALVSLTGSLTGCTAAQPISCGAAFDEVEPLEVFPGVDYLVSGDLAETLLHCDTVAQSVGALRDHSDIVNRATLADSDAYAYLAGSCGLLPEEGTANPVCAEALAAGLYSDR